MSKMTIICRHVVKPAKETWKGNLSLSELDQIAIITPSSHLYFYEKPTQEDWVDPSNNKILSTLKDSLSRVLVPFYPLAGRLSWIDGGGGRLLLECNGMGAELIEVESTMKIADYGDFYPRSQSFEHLLVQLDYYGKTINDLPVLAVQLTRFACGGLCVGVSMSHVVVDGKSAFHFTEEWARLARGEPLLVAPFLDRRVLQGSSSSTAQLNNNLIEDTTNYEYFRKLDKGGKQVTPTFVLLTKDKVEQLKEVANVNNHGRPYSRFEAIAAHVWRCVSKARARHLKADTTTLTVCADSRGRMEPPLPPSYFGNGIVDMDVSSCREELMAKPLSYACSKIREATSKVTHEYVTETVEFLKNEQSVTKYQCIDDRGRIQTPSNGEDGNNNVMVMSWLNLVGRGIDFGWGKEVHMGPPIVYAGDGNTMITPYKNDGSVVIGICLQPDNKQVFHEYFSQLDSINM